MYKSHQERNGAFNKSSVWKSLTSKTYVVILCLLVLFIVSVSAEEEVHYGYSIQVKDAHGLSLPKPIIPIDHLSKGLTIEICNLTDKPDSFMLVFICDNSVMRYNCVGFELSELHQFDIDSNSCICLDVHFSDESIARINRSESFVHAILIGLLNKYPRNAFDNIAMFTTTVSLPIQKLVGDKVNSDNGKMEFLANLPLGVDDKSSYICGFRFLDSLGNSLPGIVVESEQTEVDIYYSITGGNYDAFLLFFVNNQILRINGKYGVTVKLRDGYAFNSRVKLTIPSGESQFYGLLVPLNQQAEGFVTSEKILIRNE